MEEKLKQLWDDIHFNQSEFYRKTGKIRFILTTVPQHADEAIALTSECREIVGCLNRLGLEVLALGGTLSVTDHATEQTQIPDAGKEDVEELYRERIARLDDYAKYAFELRKSIRKYEVPWGGIKAHEKDGRHLIRDHVGQGIRDLKRQREKNQMRLLFHLFPTKKLLTEWH